MKCIPRYRVGYNGKFYESGHPFEIDAKDAEEMRQHGTVLDDPMPPSVEQKRVGRPARRATNGQSGKAETENG